MTDEATVDVKPRGLFRSEALAEVEGNARTEGEPLRLSPAWSGATFWVLAAAFAVAFIVLVWAKVGEYARGPAVVWVKGRLDLTATLATTVTSVDVHAGERVEAGAVLARFYAASEEAELTRLDRELDLQIARTLRDPGDREARAAVATLATQKDLARARTDQLTLRAPRSGVVGDVRIREGQHLVAGDIVVTLWDEGAPRTLIALLPGHAQPLLRPGMPMRFEVKGYKYAYLDLVIDSVGTQIVGPAEVKRYLGSEIADTVPLEGSFVLVEAKIPGGTLRIDDVTLDLRHGMSGVAEGRMRSERLIVALFPALRALTGPSR